MPHPEAARCEELRRRFEREARATASLDHPHINPIFETSDSGAAELFIASHYCAGGTLADWLKHRLASVPPRSAAHLVATMAHAVQHAHERGILHRDLKPSNVLLEPVSRLATSFPQGPATFEGFVPRLCDFGLARIQQEALEDDRTRTGTLVGTPRYMAPEQAIGATSEIGPRSDVYALGVILYELLVGRPPFVGDTELETLRQIRSDAPISIRRLQPKVPRDLDTIVLKCLEKEVKRRYQSAGDLAADLERFAADQPIVARPQSLARRTRLWTRRHPVQAIVLLTGLLVALALPAGLTWHNRRLERAFEVANDQRVRAETFEAQARKNERTALDSAADVERLVYASDMRLAGQLLKEGDFPAAASIIDRYDPKLVTGEDRRGFEWWHLQPYRNIERRTWQAHSGELNMLAFSRDGRVMMTASYADRRATTWDAESGRQLATFPTRPWTEPRDRQVGALSPDGKLVATIVDDDHFAIRDAITGQVQARVKAKGPLFCINFSPDGQWLVAGGMKATNVWKVGVWDSWQKEIDGTRLSVFAPDGGSLATMWQPRYSTDLQLYMFDPGPREDFVITAWYPVNDIAYSADGRLLATTSDGPKETVIYLHNADTGETITSVRRKDGRLRGVGFSNDGKMIASVTEVGGLQLWDSNSGNPLVSFSGAGKQISQFAFSPDGRSLATATVDGAVSVWDCTLLVGNKPIEVSAACCAPVVFSPTDERVAVANIDHSIILVNAATALTEQRLEGHRDRVAGIAFAPDGSQLASVDGRHLRCWNVADGQSLWAAPAKSARDVAWSPTAAILATGGRDGHVRLFDAGTGKPLFAFEKQDHEINAVRFFPDGQRLASCTADGTIHIWQLERQKPEYAVQGEPLYSLAISSDGRLLAALGPTGRGLLYRIHDGKPPELWEPPLDWYPGSAPWFAGLNSSILFSPDGAVLGRAGAGGIFRADDRTTRAPLYALSGRGIAPVSVAFSRNAQTLAAVSSANELTFWDTATWQGRRIFGAPLAAVRGLSFSPDGKQLAVATDHSPHVETRGYADFPGAPNVRLDVRQPADRDDEESRAEVDYIPWQTTAGSLRFWDVESKVEQNTWQSAVTLAMLPTVAWDPTKQLVAAASRDGTLWVWDARDRTIVARRFLDDRVRRHVESAPEGSPPLVPQSALKDAVRPRVAFSPDGARLAAIDTYGRLKLWGTDRWEPLTMLPGQHAEVHCLAFSPDGATLLSNNRGQAQLYEVPTGRLIGTLRGETNSNIMCGGFSPDGKWLALGTLNGKIHCFDAASRELFRSLVGHLDSVSSLAISPDGQTLATGGWDTTVRLWNVASGREVALLEGHRGRVHALAFSPDGGALASGGEMEGGTGEVRLWSGNRDQTAGK